MEPSHNAIFDYGMLFSGWQKLLGKRRAVQGGSGPLALPIKSQFESFYDAAVPLYEDCAERLGKYRTDHPKAAEVMSTELMWIGEGLDMFDREYRGFTESGTIPPLNSADLSGTKDPLPDTSKTTQSEYSLSVRESFFTWPK